MPYCSNCGNMLANEAKFCTSCGSATSNTTKMPTPASQSQHQQVFEGAVHKCPNCGEALRSFEATCPACGHELRSVRPANSVMNLAQKLEQAESNEEKNDLIRSFYIPNTKEDIYEFFILASSNINAGGRGVDAWKAKLDQTYQKAELVIGQGPELVRLRRLYRDVRKRDAFTSLANSRVLLSGVLFIIGLPMMIVGGFEGNASGDLDSPFYFLAALGFILLLGAGTHFFEKE